MDPVIATDLSNQRERLIRTVSTAARKATGSAFDALKEAGVLNSDNLQQILKKEEELVSALTVLIKNKFAEYADNKVGNVKLLSGSEVLTLEPMSGTETFAKEPEIFTGTLPAIFSGRIKGDQIRPTGVTKIAVYEMAKDCDIEELFVGFGVDLDRLCLTQGQIIQFIKRYFVWVHPKHHATFLLVKAGGEFHVVYVFRSGQNPIAFIYPFAKRRHMLASDRRRVVVPKL